SVGAHLPAGVEDSIRLLREALADIADTRRTYTVTRKQLSNAIDALAASLDPLPVDAAGWAARFVELRARAHTVADIAQTLTQERGDPPDSELHAWADAARACVESHARDVEILIPWARLDPEEIVAMAGRPPEKAPEWAAIEPFFRSIPALADAP